MPYIWYTLYILVYEYYFVKIKHSIGYKSTNNWNVKIWITSWSIKAFLSFFRI